MKNISNPDSAPIVLLGVPFDNVTTSQTVDLIEQMVTSRRPHHLVTANVDFLVQALHDVELHRILTDAHMVLCDGMPLVWASRLLGNPLPERVAGSDLVPLLIKLAAKKKYRIFFLGGTPETTTAAVEKLRAQYPELIIAGHYSPPFANLLDMDHPEICRRIQEAQPDLLFVSFGCPKQEKWISMHYRSLGVPVAVGVGATIDFLAGRAQRAPRWMQKTGTQWLHRLVKEPRRLFRRYATDLPVFSRAILHQWWRLQVRWISSAARTTPQVDAPRGGWLRIRMPAQVDGRTLHRDLDIYEQAVTAKQHCLMDLSGVKFIDSSGIGLLLRLQRRARLLQSRFVLLAPSAAVQSALRLMRVEDRFSIAQDSSTAKKITESGERSVSWQTNFPAITPSICWRGEITALNAEQVWRSTECRIAATPPAQNQFLIDLSALRFIDSTGVSLMLLAKKNASRKGLDVAFTGTRPNVRNVLRLARVESILLDNAA